jgi:CubicO group peptidase (beta-lactamase class C family)
LVRPWLGGTENGTMTEHAAAGAAEFEAKLARFVKDNRLAGTAAAVVRGDELAWSGGAGFADIQSGRLAAPDTLYRLASITKTFTGTAVMQLRDAGRLDLDDPAVQWLPELKLSGSPQTIGRVTIRRLLSHEAGLTSEPPGTDWTLISPRYQGLAESNLARAAEIVTAIGPNLQTKYCNLGYQLLGEIVRRASGTDFPAYVRQQILDPLSMASTAFEPLPHELAARRATGYSRRTFSDQLDVAPEMPQIWAEGGLWSSAQDVARWISFQLRAHDDDPRDSPVLAAASLREMHKPRYLSDDAWTTAWGISWYAVRKDDVTWVQHSGGLHGFTTNACFDPKQQVGAVVLVNGEADAPALCMELAGIARRLVEAGAPKLRPAKPTPPEYRGLLGLYASPAMSELGRVEWRDGKLVIISLDDPGAPVPLLPGPEADTFVGGPGFRDSGEIVRFTRKDGGPVTAVYVGSATLLRLDPVAPELGTGDSAG